MAEIREKVWEAALATGLREAGRSGADLVSLPRRQEWKLELVSRIRAETGAPYGWLSEALNLGKPATLRSYLCRRPAKQRTTA